MPGHAASIAIGRPDAVVDCKPDDTAPLYDGSYQSSSQLDPSNPATFTLVEHLITELVTIFPDKYLHFGGVSTHLPSVLGSCLFPLMNRVGVVCFCIDSKFKVLSRTGRGAGAVLLLLGEDPRVHEDQGLEYRLPDRRLRPPAGLQAPDRLLPPHCAGSRQEARPDALRLAGDLRP